MNAEFNYKVSGWVARLLDSDKYVPSGSILPKEMTKRIFFLRCKNSPNLLANK